MIVEKQKFDKEYAVKCIEANRHNFITATYHLVYKSQLKTGASISEVPSVVTGSIDRQQAQTRAMKNLKQEEIENQNRVSKRGHSINTNHALKGEINYTLPQNYYPALKLGDQKLDILNNDRQLDETDLSAQKKYKLQLQADIVKLKQKYNQVIQPQKANQMSSPQNQNKDPNLNATQQISSTINQ